METKKKKLKSEVSIQKKVGEFTHELKIAIGDDPNGLFGHAIRYDISGISKKKKNNEPSEETIDLNLVASYDSAKSCYNLSWKNIWIKKWSYDVYAYDTTGKKVRLATKGLSSSERVTTSIPLNKLPDYSLGKDRVQIYIRAFRSTGSFISKRKLLLCKHKYSQYVATGTTKHKKNMHNL